jgi:CcmD family protein
MTLATLASIGGAVAAFLQDSPAPGAAAAALEPAQVARGFRFLAAAYTIVWVILAVYIMTLSVRIRRLSQQVHRLKERLGI